MKIGILGLHGSKDEHAKIIEQLGHMVVFLKNKNDFAQLDGIILPGGESTSFGRLLEWSRIKNILKTKILEENIPVFGTCAGSILLASSGSEYCIGALNMKIDRNAYGRQVDSFSDTICIQTNKKKENKTFHAIFIRAPKIKDIQSDIEILAEYKNSPVLVRSKTSPRLAATFHPELTNDHTIHKIFIDMIQKHQLEK